MEQQLTDRLGAWDPTSGVSYLIEANERAARRVAKLEVNRLRRPQAATVPVRVSIHFDPKGEQPHAYSVRGTSEIRWALQLEEYSLWAALVADRVFEHEYFCHLLPINTHLSIDVREGFLDGVLQYEHALQATADTEEALAESRWNYALHKFRDDLWDHFSEAPDENHWKLRNLAQNPQGKDKSYWPLVASILDHPDGAAGAKEVKDALFRMAGIRESGA